MSTACSLYHANTKTIPEYIYYSMKINHQRQQNLEITVKRAKPAFCSTRIAKAILGDVTLHNSNFLSTEN